LNDEGDAEITTTKARVTGFRHCEEIKELAVTTIAYRKMVKQIDKYWDKLFAEPIQVATTTGAVSIQRNNWTPIL